MVDSPGSAASPPAASQPPPPPPAPSTLLDQLLKTISDLITPTPSTREAARLLTQASFGPTEAAIEEVKKDGVKNWLEGQLAEPIGPTFLSSFDERRVLVENQTPNAGATINDFHFLWFKRATTDRDQLRHRVAFALSQIFVVSYVDGDVGSDIRMGAAYYDVLYRNAFGNYRTLLDDVTRSPAMGIYLTYLGNQKEDAAGLRSPDQNYARELMQLFTIGLWKLNPDGTLALDENKQPIHSYTSDDVAGLAKVFTGLSWAQLAAQPHDTLYTMRRRQVASTMPMGLYDVRHSTSEKKFLGTTIPAATTPAAAGATAADLKVALDTLFNHPNVPPFISRQLIQRLVTSNPTPAYVARVAKVFENDGTGVRGNLKAVVQAILLDREARDSARTSDPAFGKLREPLIRSVHLARAFGATSKSGIWLGYDVAPIGQRALYAPSVFNFWRPGFIPSETTRLGTKNLTAPEFQTVSPIHTIDWVNFVIGFFSDSTTRDVILNFDPFLVSAGDAAGLTDRIAAVLLDRPISADLRAKVIKAVSSVTVRSDKPENTRADQIARIRIAATLIAVSPEYIAQH